LFVSVFICVCVCVCVWEREREREREILRECWNIWNSATFCWAISLNVLPLQWLYDFIMSMFMGTSHPSCCFRNSKKIKSSFKNWAAIRKTSRDYCLHGGCLTTKVNMAFKLAILQVTRHCLKSNCKVVFKYDPKNQFFRNKFINFPPKRNFPIFFLSFSCIVR